METNVDVGKGRISMRYEFKEVEGISIDQTMTLDFNEEEMIDLFVFSSFLAAFCDDINLPIELLSQVFSSVVESFLSGKEVSEEDMEGFIASAEEEEATDSSFDLSSEEGTEKVVKALQSFIFDGGFTQPEPTDTDLTVFRDQLMDSPNLLKDVFRVYVNHLRSEAE